MSVSSATLPFDETIIKLADTILGGLLLDPIAIERIYNILDPKDFPLHRHKLIVQAVKDLHYREQPVDLMTVLMELHRRGQVDEVGGQGYLLILVEKTVSAVNIDYYCLYLKDAIKNFIGDGKMKRERALELIKEYMASDRTEEELVLGRVIN